MSDMREFAEKSNAWPFAEARAILKRLNGKTPEKGYVLFETGYGPSGLPHIGTFGEVARTSWVRHAFHQLSDIPTRLFAFSDDMDGLRKVPDNIENKQIIEPHLGKPLTWAAFSTESIGRLKNPRLILEGGRSASIWERLLHIQCCCASSGATTKCTCVLSCRPFSAYARAWTSRPRSENAGPGESSPVTRDWPARAKAKSGPRLRYASCVLCRRKPRRDDAAAAHRADGASGWY